MKKNPVTQEKGAKKLFMVIGSKDDPGSLYHQMLPYLAWMRTLNFSEVTIYNRRVLLREFITWCDERGLQRPQEVTRPILERYQQYLSLYRRKDGQALRGASQAMRVTALKMWFRWLTRTYRILSNPAADLDMPRLEKRLPQQILTADEADKILNGVNLNDPMGIRDRAILETLYSTGIRRAEVADLYLHDIDYDRGTLMVRQGKGKKDRLLPIGDRALAWIAKYRDEVRPSYALANDEGILFILHNGEQMGLSWITRLVSVYIERADIGKRGSCHLFRHTMATLMLENGADIRFIQAMLGHVRLDATMIYTHVAINKLKEIHTLTHPARLERKVNQIVGGDEIELGDGGENTVDLLLAALDEEAKEDGER